MWMRGTGPLFWKAEVSAPRDVYSSIIERFARYLASFPDHSSRLGGCGRHALSSRQQAVCGFLDWRAAPHTTLGPRRVANEANREVKSQLFCCCRTVSGSTCAPDTIRGETRSGTSGAQVGLPLAPAGFALAARACRMDRDEDNGEHHRCRNCRDELWCDAHGINASRLPMRAILREDATKTIRKAK